MDLLIVQLTRKVFWFQSNLILFFAHQKARQDYGLLWNSELCPAVPSSPIHSPEGLEGEEINPGEGSAKGIPGFTKIQGLSHLGQPVLLCPCQAVLQSRASGSEHQVLFSGQDAQGTQVLTFIPLGWESLVSSFKNCGNSLGSCPDSYMPLGLRIPISTHCSLPAPVLLLHLVFQTLSHAPGFLSTKAWD